MEEILRVAFAGASVLVSAAALVLALISYRTTQSNRFREDIRALRELEIEVLKLNAQSIGRIDAISTSITLSLAEETTLLSESGEDTVSDQLLQKLRNRLTDIREDVGTMKSSITAMDGAIPLIWMLLSKENLEDRRERLLRSLINANKVSALVESEAWTEPVKSFNARVDKLLKSGDA